MTDETSLFVGSGSLLALGGPAFILAGYTITALTAYCGIVTALTEIATYLPVHGGTMSYYAHRYVSPSLGFALGYLYWYALGILVPYEITAAGLVIGYWPNDINIAVWISIMIVVIVGLNFLPVKYYGETEFWFAGTKVLLMIGLLLLSFILFWGGGPNRDRLGFRYWKQGAAHSYLVDGDAGLATSFFATLIKSVFPFTFAPELLVVTGGEMQSPRHNLPIASRRYFYRIIVFFVFGVLAIGVTCPSDDPRLTSGGQGAGSSPFVVAIADAGITTLPSIVNAVILLSAWSSGNSFLYISSRSMYSLAIQGSAPGILKSCNRWGVPYMAVGVSSLFCGLAYLNVASGGAVVFDWFVNLTNTWGMISWTCCTVVYIRFRKATEIQGVERPYTSIFQPYSAYFAGVLFALLCICNGFPVFFPGHFSASSFLTAYVGMPIFLVMYLGHRALHWKDKWAWSPEEIDLRTGLDEVDAAAISVKKRKGIARICRLVE